ncbi:LysR family transcriptional regulator [Variovorax paradoxus]|jgi:DNA-binding transcriptional LysR family regulator|uniref:LysR family transcriptional regulator n=1 Tax=Variovorax paradoxus TaxID=34073 RepID=UPI0029C6F5A7|nr:LysR family transcriptional regulator [Variovorax paradoxus]WPH23082.1 LysR family transcriptional regulator [Variovorax paradoxus]
MASPTLRQLELLLALVSSDGIAGAGAKLGMSPSATSHALRALETALGTELVDRNASGVALTYTGEHVLPHVRDVFASLQLVQATALAGAELKTGLLRMGSFGASATTRVLPPLLERFKARYPGVDVMVTEKPDEQTSRDLIERRLELAAVTLPKPDFDSQTLAIDELVAVLPSGHPLAKLETVPLKEMTVDPFILTRAGSQALVTKLFSRNGLRPRVTYELLQLMSILELVAKGKGISVLAKLALPDRYEGTVFRPMSPGTSRRIGLACLNESRLSPVARAFWQETRRYHASLKSASR